MNTADSHAIERQLAGRGYTPAGPGECPDLWVVNTCAVTAEGMRKSRKMVRRCARHGSPVIVTGCAAEMEPSTFQSFNCVKAVVPNSEKHRIVDSISGHDGDGSGSVAWTPGEKVRVPVKVQDGCERFCSYCIVPYLRGTPVSREIRTVLEEVRFLRSNGVAEFNVCGIDLGSYRDRESGAGLEELTSLIIDAADGGWVRLSSIEMSDVSDGLLEMMRERETLCRHLHIPLQSGDDGVLADMGRFYSTRDFGSRVAEIREAVPDVGVTSDVMVGFPTESEDAFNNTKVLLETVGFSRIHVFRYSPREKTSAFSYGDRVDKLTKARRALELRELAGSSASRFNAGFVGRIIPVLVEETMRTEPGWLFGRAGNYLGVVFKGESSLVGRVVRVRATEAGPEGLRGEITNAQLVTTPGGR